MRPIDADELLKHAWFCDIDHWSGKVVDEDIINNAPTLDVAPVVHGRWLETENGDACSVCGCGLVAHFANADIHIQLSHCNYCLNCGAKMDLEDQDD